MKARTTIAAAALLAGGAFASASSLPQYFPGNLSAYLTTALGALTGRSIAARAVQLMSPADFKLWSDSDDTASFQRAIAWALAQSNPTQITVPCGQYTISGSLGATVNGSNFSIVGQSAGCVRITQTADADAFAFTVPTAPGLLSKGGVELKNLSVTMSASAPSSTTRYAFAVIGSETSGQVGVPVILSNLSYTSTSASAYWGYGVYVYGIADGVFIDHINGASSGGSTVNMKIDSQTNYITSVFVRDVWTSGGSAGVVVGSYWQGVHFDNLNILNTPVGFTLQSSTASSLNTEVQLTNSYIMGAVAINSASGATLSDVMIHHNVFDCTKMTTGSTCITLGTAGGATISGLDFSANDIQGASGVANNLGVLFQGLASHARFIANRFSGFTGTGAVALSNTNTTYVAQFIGNAFMNNATNISETGVTNAYIGNAVNNSVTTVGNNTTQDGVLMAPSANLFSYSLTGPDTYIAGKLKSKGMANGAAWSITDGNNNVLLKLNDAGSGTTNCGFSMSSVLSGSQPILASSCAAGISIPDATASTSATTGALVIGGGLGVGGNIYTSGLTASSSITSSGGSIYAPAHQYVGGGPTSSGACAASSFTGGSTGGQFILASACAATTVTLTFVKSASNGFVCNFIDETTPANTVKQTSHTTNSVSATASTSAGDRILYSCMGY